MDGVLLVDKPPGVSSHDVVAGVRRELGGRRGPRVGHAGTLDPFATGLLLVLTGRATRAQRFLMGLDKAYEVVARLGWTSTTGDPEGELVATGRVPPPGAPLPTGRIRQRPPAFSAVKVGGERAYRRARRGEAVEVPEREVVVHRFEERWRAGDRAGYVVECGSGTYVRSLVAALGDAYCLELRRTAIGPFRVEDADPARPLPLGDALARVLPVADLDAGAARAAAHGRPVPVPAPPPAGAPLLLRDDAGPVAVAEALPGLPAGHVRTVVGFRA